MGAAAAAKAKAANDSEVRPSHMHSASQPTLQAFGDVWAANCRAAQALQARAGDSDQGQALQAAKSKGKAKEARIPRKRK